MKQMKAKETFKLTLNPLLMEMMKSMLSRKVHLGLATDKFTTPTNYLGCQLTYKNISSKA